MPKVILVVEDDQTYQDFFLQRLKVFGYEVTALQDTTTILDHFRTGDPHLIIVDLSNANEALALVHRIRSGGHQNPILMVSSDDRESSIRQAIKSGISDYLVKPFELNTLMSKVRQLVQQEST